MGPFERKGRAHGADNEEQGKHAHLLSFFILHVPSPPFSAANDDRRQKVRGGKFPVLKWTENTHSLLADNALFGAHLLPH
jgi:hypothetical protein